MSDYRKAFDSDSVPEKNIALRKAHDEIASLRAQLAEANSSLAALNLCEPGFLDRVLRERDGLRAQLAKAAEIVEGRMIWWRNSSDERIRDGSENAYIAAKIRALTDENGK